ncbi:hypothetical protein [Salinarimonas soli]|uniref:Uncharacterized protein n=1 Tax=Salinarimonas soli TaxID=1638099 RepID=A0A5B2VCZ2_9HYPH|nr:hypothetical protein [Salinarimonas soli]KAA2236615.1 hypothetical protein F0L46_14195 [Salinarimonas soli]
MRLAALALVLLTAPALAQTPKRPRLPESPPAQDVSSPSRGTGVDPLVQQRQELQQKRWDDTNRRALGGICRGC